MPREEVVVTWGLQEGKEGYVPSQIDRRENTGVLEDIRFTSDQIMYDTLSEGKRNNNNKLRDRQEIRRSRGGGDDRPKPMAWGWSLDAT